MPATRLFFYQPRAETYCFSRRACSSRARAIILIESACLNLFFELLVPKCVEMISQLTATPHWPATFGSLREFQ
jgi:hypothetical protein